MRDFESLKYCFFSLNISNLQECVKFTSTPKTVVGLLSEEETRTNLLSENCRRYEPKSSSFASKGIG